MSSNDDKPKAVGPATAAIVQSKAFDRTSYIDATKRDVLAGKSIADALLLNKLPDGSLPCSKQNLRQCVNRAKRKTSSSEESEASAQQSYFMDVIGHCCEM